MQRKGRKPMRKSTGPAKQTPSQQQPMIPEQPQAGGLDVLKERFKNANKGGLLEALNKVKNTSPDQWKNPSTVKNMARELAQQFNLNVNEERLNQLANAFQDATKGGEPNANVEQLVKKYGAGQVDQQTVEEMKKFIK